MNGAGKLRGTGAGIISRFKSSSTIIFTAAALALILAAMLAAAGCGDSAGSPSIYTGNNGRDAPLTSRDIKLLADFQNQELFSRGKRIYFDALETEGAVHFDGKQGMAVYKGGVNEIVDPSFEGKGWVLGAGTALDAATASHGKKSLRVAPQGTSGVVARLAERMPVAADQAYDPIALGTFQAPRTLSFDHQVTSYAGGALTVRLVAFDAGGAQLGFQDGPVDPAASGWVRDGGFIYRLPPGTASYTVEVVSDGFKGVANLDAFQSEAKDFFTPYFDGDSENCMWVRAATPQVFHGELYDSGTKRASILWASTAVFGAGAALSFGIGAWRRKLGLMLLPLMALPPVTFLLLIVAGVGITPDSWPLKLRLAGSMLEANDTYYYRVTSVDAQGKESPPSAEARVRTNFNQRISLLQWEKDVGAVKYRVYRGVNTYGEDRFFEVNASDGYFIDEGREGVPGRPPLEEGEDTGWSNASRSLRPSPDVSISNTRLGFDPTVDFWVTGEAEFDFSNDAPYRPASYFEIGDPSRETQLAFSTRYLPAVGDEFSKVIVIKTGSQTGQGEISSLPLEPVHPGSVIRYVAAQLYSANGDLPAGVHLWYRIDGGEVKHITFPNVEPIDGQPTIRISKRWHFDEFGNNSYCRSIAIVAGKVSGEDVASMMEPGDVPERLSFLTGGR
ncbi:MAG: hypothetical protein M1539_05115 [Actinobacteria bacterium]|nr:hypothetical protein [Actinomycetota bacterium]